MSSASRRWVTQGRSRPSYDFSPFSASAEDGPLTNASLRKEGTALNPFEEEFKIYAPGIGLIGDEDLRVTKYGFIDEI